MVELIVTEKPAQAEKIALALAEKKPIKKIYQQKICLLIIRTLNGL